MLNLEQIKRELKKYNFAYEENVLPVHANGHYFLYGFFDHIPLSFWFYFLF